MNKERGKTMKKNEETLLKVTESIDTQHLSAKRNYSVFLTSNTNGAPINTVVIDKVSSYRITKSIYVRLSPEDELVEDLRNTKAFFRAKITLKLSGDKI
jgi:hypothetical protein